MTLLRAIPLVAKLVLLVVVAATPAAARLQDQDRLHDDQDAYSVPAGFFLGAGSSAYQIEGAWNTSGKGPSTTDQAYGDRADGGGAVACDSYHHYEEDVELLKLMGATHYRFSLAWSRLLPTGEAADVNPDGVRYYNALIDRLKGAGIEPVVTLWHVDVPLALEKAFGGWHDPKMVEYFEAYARTAFTNFGDRVKVWTTVNEPHMFCVYGAGKGRMGASIVEPGVSEYLCGHHVLLAHARAYRAYKKDFASQGGMVGLSLDSYYTKPCSGDYDDVRAAERHQHFEVGWFLDPILGDGDYPAVMRQRVGERLPALSAEDRVMLKGALDFVGLNSYYGWTGCDGVPANAADPSYERDQGVIIPEATNQNLPPGNFQWSPWSIRSSLLWMRDRYGDQVPFIVTENGYGDDGAEGLLDVTRVAYISAWMRELLYTVKNDGVNVIGYFVWSLLDDFEWGVGYTVKLGLAHVDFDSPNRTRTPKESLHFMKDVIAKRTVPMIPRPSSASSTSLTNIFKFLLASSLILLKYIL